VHARLAHPFEQLDISLQIVVADHDDVGIRHHCRFEDEIVLRVPAAEPLALGADDLHASGYEPDVSSTVVIRQAEAHLYPRSVQDLPQLLEHERRYDGIERPAAELVQQPGRWSVGIEESGHPHEVIVWYVLRLDFYGNRYWWDGPHAEAALRQAAAEGLLRGDVGLMSVDGRVTTVQIAFAPRESAWATLGKLALIGGGVFLAAKAVAEVAQYLSDTTEQRSIRRSARKHASRGADVCADHIGWDCAPPLLGRRRPDVVADYGDRLVIEEHETVGSVGRRHSIDQDRDLRLWAARRSYARYRQVVA